MHQLMFLPIQYGLNILFCLYVVGLLLIKQGPTPTENITLAVDQYMLSFVRNAIIIL